MEKLTLIILITYTVLITLREELFCMHAPHFHLLQYQETDNRIQQTCTVNNIIGNDRQTVF